MLKASSEVSLSSGRTVSEVEKWLVDFLVETLSIPASSIDLHTSFNAYGLDSSALVGFTDALGRWLGRDLDPTLLYDHPNVHALARAIGREERP